MVSKCCAFYCKNRAAKSRRPGLTFHRFPKRDLKLRRRWIEAVRRINPVNPTKPLWEPLNGAVLCSDHFTEDSLYSRTQDGNNILVRLNAVPSIFNVPTQLTISRKECNPLQVAAERGATQSPSSKKLKDDKRKFTSSHVQPTSTSVPDSVSDSKSTGARQSQSSKKLKDDKHKSISPYVQLTPISVPDSVSGIKPKEARQTPPSKKLKDGKRKSTSSHVQPTSTSVPDSVSDSKSREARQSQSSKKLKNDKHRSISPYVQLTPISVPDTVSDIKPREARQTPSSKKLKDGKRKSTSSHVHPTTTSIPDSVSDIKSTITSEITADKNCFQNLHLSPSFCDSRCFLQEINKLKAQIADLKKQNSSINDFCRRYLQLAQRQYISELQNDSLKSENIKTEDELGQQTAKP